MRDATHDAQATKQADRSIMLVGLPGAGKSTVGRLLAERLGLPFVDSDALIEAKTALNIAEIFRRHGETWFRQVEERIIAGLLGGPMMIIASGGGAFLASRTRAQAMQQADVIWLDADVGTLAPRVESGTRPLLKGELRSDLAAMKRDRDPLYALAHIRVDAASPPLVVVDALLARLAHLRPAQPRVHSGEKGEAGRTHADVPASSDCSSNDS